MATIEITNVGLTYRVLKNKTGSLKELFRDFIFRKVRVENYQALKDVSFVVEAWNTKENNGTILIDNISFSN